MPKPKHENCVRIVNQLINDPIRSVNDLANKRVVYFWNNLAYLGKCSDEECLVDEDVAELASAFGTVTRDVSDNLTKVILRLRSENYWPAQVSTSLRASSAGIPSRRAACSRAVLMPASNSISRAICASSVSSGSLERRWITISLLLIA